MATWTVACMDIAIGLLSLVGQYAILASVPSLYARSRPSNVIILIRSGPGCSEFHYSKVGIFAPDYKASKTWQKMVTKLP